MDLATAQQKLTLWQSAEDALARSKSYSVGDISVTRQDLPEVRKQIQYYTRMVNQLTYPNRGIASVASFDG